MVSKQKTLPRPDSSTDLNALSNWYKNLKAICPFQFDNSCGIYEQRPMVCREHFITGSARACKSERDNVEVIQLPLRMSEVLSQLACELEDTDAEAIMLPLALIWSRENLSRSERTWPAITMVTRFAEIVKTMAYQNSTQMPVLPALSVAQRSRKELIEGIINR